jgi:cell division transport system permease protein
VQKFNSRKKLGSYPYVGVIISITLALFVTGLFGMLIIYSRGFERLVRENIRLEVYLKNGLTETQRLQVEKKLETLPYISTSQTNEPSIRYISKEDAAKKFIAETGEDFTKFYGDNPLHDAYLINIDPQFHTETSMEKIKKEIQEMNGVFEVSYVDNLIKSVNKNFASIGLVLSGLIALLLITVVLLVNNTLRLALFSQRFLIRSMQLVGARKWFIQRPFLVRSVAYGILSGILASTGIYLVVNFAHRSIEDLALLYNRESMFILMGGLLTVGVLVAVASTFFSIHKYLKMSLDELY